MTDKIDDGGPAFPGPTKGGMSLRDWFAGMAMQGRLSRGFYNPDLAKESYEIADAMLKARKENPNG